MVWNSGYAFHFKFLDSTRAVVNVRCIVYASGTMLIRCHFNVDSIIAWFVADRKRDRVNTSCLANNISYPSPYIFEFKCFCFSLEFISSSRVGCTIVHVKICYIINRNFRSAFNSNCSFILAFEMAFD